MKGVLEILKVPAHGRGGGQPPWLAARTCPESPDRDSLQPAQQGLNPYGAKSAVDFSHKY